jgi:translocation and assembly module TamB
MKKLIALLVLLLLAGLAVGGGLAIAQDDERGRFVRFVERQISTPDRQIRLGRIEGALSSDVRISAITIADRRGVWLTIENVHLVWSRFALLRGRLDIDLLEADSITVSRLPLPAEDTQPIEEGAEFSLPSLPVEVLIDRLAVGRVALAEGVIGPSAELSVDGSVQLADGALDARLAIERRDQPGQLQLATTFNNESRQLTVNFSIAEPENGVIANALNIPGRPPISFTIEGAGPLSDFTANVALAASGETLLSGTTVITGVADGLRFVTDISGNLVPLVADLYRPFVEGGTEISLDLLRREDGSLAISDGLLKSGVAELAFAASLTSDFVPTSLSVNGNLARPDGEPLVLPGLGTDGTVRSARITADLASETSGFSASIEVNGLDTPFIVAPAAELRAEGTATNLSDAATRAVTFTVTGRATDLASERGGVADALGSSLAIDASGDWTAGQPLRIDGASVETDTLAASFAGTVQEGLTGSYRLEAQDLSAFAAITGRDLAGSVDLGAEGTVGFDGLFDLTIDASAEGLAVGIAQVDGLLSGTTTIEGRAARTVDGVAFDGFRVNGDQLTAAVDGEVTNAAANLSGRVTLADLSVLDARLAGAAAAELSVTGDPATPTVQARLSSDSLVLDGETLSGLAVVFDGTLDRTSPVPFDLDGALTVGGALEGEPLRLSARLRSAEGVRALSDLDATIADASVLGSVAAYDEGLYGGNITIDVPSLARVAPLALLEASGSIEATVALEARDGTQYADIAATARQLEAAGLAVGFATVDLAVDDVFGIPALDGRAEARAVRAGGFDVPSAVLTASRQGESTTLTVAADLGAGTLDAEGSLTRTADGFAARLARFTLAREGFAATLVEPTTVTVAGETVTVGDTVLTVGDGRLTVAGTLGETLDLRATLDALPLSVANLVRPDLDVAGTVSGDLAIGGTRLRPSATADVSATGVTAAPLRSRGIEPLTLTARGSYAEGTATVEAFETNVGGGRITAFGRAGETLDLAVEVTELPLALANAFQPGLGLSGTVSGSADLDGTLAEPEATFRVAVVNASAAPLRAANIAPLQATVVGRYADGTATLETAEAQIGGGTVRATGTIGERLDLSATVENLPLGIADAFAPDLQVRGTLSGRATATGSLDRPRVAFTVEAPSVTAAPLVRAGVAPASVTASGTFATGSVRLETAVVRVAGGELRATGTAGRRLDLRVTADGLPLAVANGFSPGLNLSGNLSATATVTGSATNPVATFEARVPNFSAAPLADAGIESVSITAAGRYANRRVELTRLTADGAGLAVSASGAVPLSGGGLDVQVNATAPLSIADRFLAGRGTRIGGTARADVRVTGSLANPSFAGSVAASDVSVRDAQANLALDGGSLSATLSGDRVVINSASATLGDGTISVSGSVGLSGGFPADLTVTARNARYADGELFAVTFDADLTVNGPLTGQPLIAGTVAVDRAEITVPERLGGGASLIDVVHRNAPPDVLETLRRARAGPFADTVEEGASPSGVVLDVLVTAPRRVFVRGRGIDAELGGEVRLTGPISNISPVGEFNLIRGRINILSQRITFERGTVTLFGDLDPIIDFVAETRANQVTVRVIVTGQASDPEIRFESEPELPQDEVLAQLIFGRSLDDLSPFQLAQLAAAAAELAGGGSGPSLVDQIRVFSGLDNLDIVTTEEGGTSVEAGRYIADNIYLGVRAGDRSSGVTINLDITRGFTLRAEALTDQSSVGVYYEREY